ncbi:hypothetical protein OE88DRAFT_514482 [Heliocybe sulcata]|uniref:Uncharacterized protein n=1 Tax=Heliocybe sulcata TaxID=5364 RepID=A0A5C3MXG3_9AGAM|nr:hypothetical protein OE88DRAFT_514482 [Heliocybe sulcata]
MDLLGSSTTDEDSALEGPTSDSSSSTSQLNNGDVLFTHFDFVTGTKVSNRLAYVFGILESCLYGSGPEGGVYERVYLSFIEDGDFDIIWLMWREGDEERLADMIPLHRWERVPHFAIQALRTRLASVLNTGPSHPDQPTADDTVYRRYAIAWKICNSRAMHEAWRLCGVHCRFDWDLGRLIKVWYEGLHEPGSPPRSPAHDLWKDRMRAEGHDCYIGLASNAPRAMALWVGMMSWMEGGSDIHPICLDPTHCAASASVLQQPVCSHGVAMYDSAHPTVDCRGVCHPQTVLILIHAPGFDIDIYNQDELESPLKAIGYGAWFRLEEFLASRVPTGTPNLRLLPWRNTYPIAAQDSLAVAICNYYYPGSLLEQYNHLRETGGNNGPAHCDIATSIGVLLAHMLGLDCSIDKWRDEIESLRSIFAELPDLDGPSSLRVEDWIRRNIIANDHTCHESIDRYSLQLWVSARLFIAAQAHDPLEFLGFEVDHPDDQSDCRACGVLKCLSHDGLLVAGGCFSKGAHAWDDILELCVKQSFIL